jgi:hypothetical protein
MVGMQADEAVAGGDGGGRFGLAVIGVGDFELRLLRIAAIGKARFELFEILDGLVVGAFGHGILGFGIQLGGVQPAVSSLTSGSRPQPPSRVAPRGRR